MNIFNSWWANMFALGMNAPSLDGVIKRLINVLKALLDNAPQEYIQLQLALLKKELS